MSTSYVTGPWRVGASETDGQIFIPATLEYSYAGTWTKTRSAAGDYNLLKTAAGDTTQSVFPLSRLFKKIGSDPLLTAALGGGSARNTIDDGTTRIRGFRITSIRPVWKNTTLDLTSATVDLHRATHTSQTGAGPTILSTVGGTLTGAALTVTASANTRVASVTLGTPYILGDNLTEVTDYAEIIWVAGATSVLTVYGIFVNFDYVLG